MQEVWFLFKILETVLGTICMGFHVRGFLNVEAIQHNLFYCGTFFGFTLIALFGSLSICVGSGPSPLMETIVNAIAAIMYITASCLSMYQAEKDFHLMYLSDFEEPLHPFFRYSKSQSIAALANGALHLMHACFALDVIIIPEPSAPPEAVEAAEDDNEPTQPIKLYVFGKDIHEKLERFRWFKKLSGNRELNQI